VKIEVLQRNDLELVFKVEGLKTGYANALRRIMISEVPVLAIDEVIIHKNSSVMYDEILALRLGLIPIKTDLERFVFQEECDCKGRGCPLCQVSLTLNKRGPGVVYSGDFISEDKEIVPVDDQIPIVKLGEGQEIELEALARLGRGKEHAKWQATNSCSYKNVPLIGIDRESCDLCGDCVERCPKKILEIRDEKLIVKDVLKCTLCKECSEACELDAIIPFHDKESFIFKVESTGSLEPEVIVIKASEILEEKAEEFLRELKAAIEGTGV